MALASCSSRSRSALSSSKNFRWALETVGEDATCDDREREREREREWGEHKKAIWYEI